MENLPKFQKFDDDDYFDSYWGKHLPFQRLKRWFESNEGQHIDSVFHKFVNLKWLLPEYRTKEQFRRMIEIDTFWQDGKVAYYDRYHYYSRNKAYSLVEDEASKCLYVHPTTKIVCIFHPKTRKSQRSEWQMERDARVKILGDYWQLYKQNGLWYEIRAEVVTHGLFSKFQYPYLRNGHWVGYPNKAPHDILLENDNLSSGKKNPIKITLKRQLGSKELKKFGLTNN